MASKVGITMKLVQASGTEVELNIGSIKCIFLIIYLITQSLNMINASVFEHD